MSGVTENVGLGRLSGFPIFPETDLPALGRQASPSPRLGIPRVSRERVQVGCSGDIA